MKDDDKYILKSAAECFEVLNALIDEMRPLQGYTLRDLCEKFPDIKLQKMARIVRTLCKYDYLDADTKNKSFRVGERFLFLSFKYMSALNGVVDVCTAKAQRFREIAKPLL